MSKLQSFLEQAIYLVPWIRSVHDKRSVRVDYTEIIKTLIVSAVVSLVVMYGTQRVIENDLTRLREDIHELKELTKTGQSELARIANEQARSSQLLRFVEGKMMNDGSSR